MDESLRHKAQALLAAAPCSIEMPAGTGKTQLLAAAAAAAAANGHRSLVLTHTNAGVDAIRKRLRAFGVPSAFVRVDTLTSWAFALVGSYSDIAGVSVGELPDWSQSDIYLGGATRVSLAQAIREVHEVSFDHLFVDEYQDCTLALHDFVLALAAAVPKSVVLGDQLQAIFGFAGPLATWPGHVLPHFPAHAIAAHPHRWDGHNEQLGAWLFDVRPQLVDGAVFDLADHGVPGLQFIGDNGSALGAVAHSFRDFDESVVLLDKWPGDVARHASRLGGSYSVMEDIGGNFMRKQLETLPAEGDHRLALWFAQFAKECVIGLGGVDAAVLGRLSANQGVTHYNRDGLSDVLRAMDALRTNPTYEQLAAAAAVVRQTSSVRVYRWEAWNDSREAIALAAVNNAPAVDNLARVP